MANIPKDVRKPVNFTECKNVKLCSIDANILPFEKNKKIVEANNENEQGTMVTDLNNGMVILAKDMDEKTLLLFEEMRQKINVKEKRSKVSKTKNNVTERKIINIENKDDGREVI